MGMNFNYWDLGQQPAGAIVQVTMSGDAANVRLFDSSNYSAFKAGRRATGYGGYATRSPVRLQIPNDGHWYVVIDYGGLPGRGQAGVEVLPGRLPMLRERVVPSLDSLTESVSRDALRQHGLRVWFDEFELGIGDSLRRNIDQGIAHSAFGVVVLSTAFFAKNWAQYELDGLLTRSVDGSQVLLPLWHRLTKGPQINKPSARLPIARAIAPARRRNLRAGPRQRPGHTKASRCWPARAGPSM
jgi:hypothetical protein